MFSLATVPSPLAANERVLLATAANGGVFLLVAPSKLLRYSIANDTLERYDVPRCAGEARALHADPHTGLGVLISYSSGETAYLFRGRGRVLGKAKGAVLTAVGWLKPDPAKPDVREVLAGSSAGAIFEALFEPTRTRLWKQLFSLSPAAPISGLQIEPFSPSLSASCASLGMGLGGGAVGGHGGGGGGGGSGGGGGGGGGGAGGGGGGGGIGGHGSASEERRLFVMVSTATRYYEFVGGHSFESLFAQYKDASQLGCMDIGGSPSAASGLDFYRRPNGKAAAFAWLTSAGVYVGSLLFASQGARDSVVYDPELIPFPTSAAARALRSPSSRTLREAPATPERGVRAAAAAAAAGTRAPMSPLSPLSPPSSVPPPLSLDEEGPPTAIALTEFHVLVLYPSCIMALSRLNKQPVCSATPPSADMLPLLGLSHDAAAKGALIAYSASGIMRVTVEHEERHVWRIHLEAGDFETALSYCSPTEPYQRDAVLSAQADHEFERGAYELAARQLAKTARPLEQVALRFMSVGEQPALRTFLLHRLDSISDDQASQLTLLCTWLCELYLLQLAETRDASEAAAAAEFRAFLADKQRHLNRTVTYSLLEAYGRSTELAHYATLCADWERLLAMHLQQRQPLAAVDRLRRLLRHAQNTPPSRAGRGDGGGRGDAGAGAGGDARVVGGMDSCVGACDGRGVVSSVAHGVQLPSAEQAEIERLLHMFSFELLETVPSETVDLWVECSFLDPLPLLPALLRYDEMYGAQLGAKSAIGNGAKVGFGGKVGSGAQGGKSAQGLQGEPVSGSSRERTPMRNGSSSNAQAPTHEGIRFLEHCVQTQQCRQAVLHNYLVLLHARRSPSAVLNQFLASGQQPSASASASTPQTRSARASAAAPTSASASASTPSSSAALSSKSASASALASASASAVSCRPATAEEPEDEDEEENFPSPNSWLRAPPPAYDSRYALRVCLEERRYSACVLLYQRQGRLEDAVALSLSHGLLRLAKMSANLADDSERRRKSLWLHIGKHVISAGRTGGPAGAADTEVSETHVSIGAGTRVGAGAGADVGASCSAATLTDAHAGTGACDSTADGDGGGPGKFSRPGHVPSDVVATDSAQDRAQQRACMRSAVQLLEECSLLRIEDLLPYFPDFALIDDIKEHIVSAVDAYASQIKALRHKMHATIVASDELRRDINRMREREFSAPCAAHCDCPQLAPTAAAICAGGLLAPCRHVAFPCGHAFRVACLEELLPVAERTRLSQIGRARLEDALAAECPLCGEAMIQSIALPFIDPVLDAALISSWTI